MASYSGEEFAAKFPEHEKLAAIRDKSQAIGEFLEWAEEQGWHLAEWDTSRQFQERMMPISRNTVGVLALYFDINQDALEQEKRTMLDEMRAAHG